MKREYPLVAWTLTFIGVSLTAFIFFDPNGIENFINIQTSTSVLLTDYLSVGSLHATFANAGLILLLNLLILKLFKKRLDGLTLAALFTIFGFAFFGKNVINSWPIYLGVIAYGKMAQIESDEYLGSMLFSSGVAPLVSYLMFGLSLPLALSISIGIVGGFMAGFVVLPIATQAKGFHQGFNLYNVGFTLGFISIIFSTILRAFAYDLTSTVEVSTAYNQPLWIVNIAIMGLFFAVAFFDRFSFKDYRLLIKTTGLGDDYLKLYGVGTSAFNIAVMGSLSLILIAVMGFPMNGPVMAGIYTVIGFGAYGKHPLNSIPVMLGAILAVWITPYSFASTGMVIAVLFVTALAPVAGKYGILAGILVGFIHVLITPFAYQLQGGFALYNNGFAAGFAAIIVVSFVAPIVTRFTPVEVKDAI